MFALSPGNPILVNPVLYKGVLCVILHISRDLVDGFGHIMARWKATEQYYTLIKFIVSVSAICLSFL